MKEAFRGLQTSKYIDIKSRLDPCGIWRKQTDFTKGIGIMPFGCVACSSIGDALWNFALIENFL
jgi:hypothetical protein